MQNYLETTSSKSSSTKVPYRYKFIIKLLHSRASMYICIHIKRYILQTKVSHAWKSIQKMQIHHKISELRVCS